MWHIDGFDSAGMGVSSIPVTGMSPAAFARVLGFDERTPYDCNEYELTGPMKAELSERLGLRFDPDLEYFAGERADFPGQVRHGLAHFADEILPLRGNLGNWLTFGLTNSDLQDAEIALLLTSNSRYPRQPSGIEFAGATREDAEAAHPDETDLIRSASAVYTAPGGYLLLIHRNRSEVTLSTRVLGH